MKHILFALALLCAPLSLFAQTTTINPLITPATAINVVASPPVIGVGATSQLSAQLLNPAPNVFRNDCPFQSSNNSIFTVSGNVVTGVAAGSAMATCTIGSITGSATITVSAVPVINNPAAGCSQPCVINSGVISSPYVGFVFTASDPGNICCTWAITAGSLPSGMSLNASTGVLSGTPSASGTFTPTVQATDSASNPSSPVQVSITISGSAPTCGPPTYSCSTTTTNNPGPITAPFASGVPTGTVTTSSSSIGPCSPTGTQSCVQVTAGTNFNTSWPLTKAFVINGGGPYTVVAWNSTTVATVGAVLGTLTNEPYAFYGACTGAECQNATGYDLTLNPSGTDCLTRMTDNSTYIGQSNNGAVDSTPNDNLSSVNEDFIDDYGTGGANHILYVNPTGNCMVAVNTGDISGSKGITVSGEFSFSRVTDTRFYYTQSQSQIWQGDLSAGTANSVNSGGNSIVTFVTNNSAAPPLPTWTGTLAVNYVNYPIVSCSGGPPATTCTVTGNTGSLSGVPYSKTDTYVATELTDLLAAGSCPGVVSFTPQSSSIMTVSQNDQRIAFTIGPGGQGSADWLFVYDKSLGCSTTNFNTGQVWNFCSSGCSSSTTPVGTLQGTLNATLEHPIVVTGSQSVLYNSGFTGTFRVADSVILDPGLTTQEQVVITAVGSGVRTFTANFTQLHSSGAVVTGTSCWGSNGAAGKGIHDTQMSLDGNYIFPSLTGPPWSQGVCSTSSIANQFSVLQIGTINDSWWYNGSNVGGGPFYNNHPSAGVTHANSYVFSGMNIRAIASPQSYTVFAPGGVVQDSHYGWPHPLGDDSYPAVGATDSMLTAQATTGINGCVYPPYCPINQVNVVQALFPNATNQTPVQFTHTWSCGPAGSIYGRCPSGKPDSYFGPQYSIGFPTQKGNFYCFSSSMLQGLGLDSNGNYHADLFCVKTQ